MSQHGFGALALLSKIIVSTKFQVKSSLKPEGNLKTIQNQSIKETREMTYRGNLSVCVYTNH